MPFEALNRLRSGSELLAKFGFLTTALAQEIQAGAPVVSLALDSNLFNDRGASQESSFNANAVAGNPAYGEALAVAGSVQADDSSFELLDTLIAAFFDANKNRDRVAGIKFGDIRVFGRL